MGPKLLEVHLLTRLATLRAGFICADFATHVALRRDVVDDLRAYLAARLKWQHKLHKPPFGTQTPN